MKRILFSLAILFCAAFSFAQHVPQGMKYQAVARNLSGNVLANQSITLKISLLTQDTKGSTIYYSETHAVTTNQVGLFTLTIGEGKIEKGTFASIPWSTADIWMQVGLKDKGQPDFVTISSSKLLAVPYAFHAETANALVGGSGTISSSPAITSPGEKGSVCSCEDGLSSLNLLYLGNSNVDIKVYGDGEENRGKLISTFLQVKNGDILTVKASPVDHNKLPDELYFKILNTTIPVIKMETGCRDAIVGGTFGNFSVISRTDTKNVTCSVCDINQSWKVGGNLVLAACNSLGSKNKTDLVLITDNTERVRILTNGDVRIQGVIQERNTNQSTSITNGAVIVDGGVGIAKNLNVGGDLNITGATTLKNTLDVTGKSRFRESVTFDKSIGITGSLSSSSINISGTDTGFLAKIENTDGDTGDGLVIKLGRTHPGWNGNSYASVTSPAEVFDGAISTIRGWVIDHNAFSPSQLLTFIPNAYIAGMACQIVNYITPKINEVLKLPLVIPDVTMPAVNMPAVVLPELKLGDLKIIGETTLFPATTLFPKTQILPSFTLLPKIPPIPCTLLGLPSLTVPNISFADVTNSLSNKNEFISFVDKDNRQLGSIRAQSVTDWGFNYLDGTYFVNLMAGMVGIDIVNGIANAVAGFTNIAKSYNRLGVEYASGHGDYAEWLPRINNSELISSGDIVGIKGGKITKDLKGAEQVMAVSYKPIMLGNAPTAEEEYSGNKIAFLGQVPVKVIGAVNMGDFIVGKSKMPGYGVAVNPAKITAEDLKLSVGRAWENSTNEGPKLINTLIGIQNGDYLNILKRSQDKLETLEVRLAALEAKMNVTTKSNSSKK
jgi:hypothetical protein